MSTTTDLTNAPVEWHRGWLSDAEATSLYESLSAGVEWQQPTVTVFGRTSHIPRLSRWFGDRDYVYSGSTNPATPLTAELASLRDRLAAETGVGYNSVLANLYRDGTDCVGWHADDEPELGDPAASVIATVVLGATRDFQLRPTSGPIISILAGHGDLVTMLAGCQQTHRHCVPRRTRVTEPRISLTFRRFEP